MNQFKIKAVFKRNSNGDHYIIELPNGMAGVFALSSQSAGTKVFLHHKTFAVKDGTIPLSPGRNEILIKN